MRIGLDLRMAGKQHGGIGRYALELASQLLKIDYLNEYYLFFNHDQQIETLKIKDNKSIIKTVKTDIPHYSLKEQISLPRILNKYNLDLAHFPNFNAPLMYKRPFVVTIHDLIHHKIGGIKKTNIAHFLAYKKVMNNAAFKSKKIITVSKASKKDILNEYKIPENKISVVYEGSNLKTKVTESQKIETMKKFFLNKNFFLFVGVMQRNKNLPLLCRGFEMFLKKFNHDFDLVIAGRKDPHYPEIKEQCMAIARKGRLVFTGPLDDEDLSALYASAYAFVSASLYEGFGLPGLEAMGFGLPLAVSNIPAFNEIYEDGAIYFDPKNPQTIAECLNLLAQDRQYYLQIKQKALNRTKQFSWENCAKQTLEVYNSVIF